MRVPIRVKPTTERAALVFLSLEAIDFHSPGLFAALPPVSRMRATELRLAFCLRCHSGFLQRPR